MTGFGELCAVCYSPLDRAEAAAEDGDPIDDVKRELFTTECNHVPPVLPGAMPRG